MAACGHTTCPDDNCGWKHLFSRKQRERCRERQQCFENYCSSLKTLGPSGFLLYDACLGHCHRDRDTSDYPGAYPSNDEYLCANFDPVTLADYFGANICAVALQDTKVGQAQAAAAASNNRTWQALGFIALVILLLSGFLIWKKKQHP